MHLEDLLPVIQVGQLHVNLTVEATGAHQCLVKHIGRLVAARMMTPLFDPKPSISVSSWLRVFSRSSFEPKLVFLPRATHSVNLIDKDDTGCLLLRLSEKVAYT